MRKVLLFAVMAFAGVSTANAQSLPEMRLTPAEVRTTSFEEVIVSDSLKLTGSDGDRKIAS